MTKCIVLNADCSILGTCSWKRAIRLIVKGRAEALAEGDVRIHPSMFAPKVIRLIKAIRSLWRKEVPWSKQNVHVRDGFKCQYCGNSISKSKVTIDHVIPRAQGGKNLWENTVTACFECNNKKEDRTPSQAHMTLIRKLTKPTIMEFVLRKVKSEGLDKALKDLGIY
jgi:5-methylcytosine-specific restriction endonuclease McrA